MNILFRFFFFFLSFWGGVKDFIKPLNHVNIKSLTLKGCLMFEEKSRNEIILYLVLCNEKWLKVIKCIISFCLY